MIYNYDLQPNSHTQQNHISQRAAYKELDFAGH